MYIVVLPYNQYNMTTANNNLAMIDEKLRGLYIRADMAFSRILAMLCVSLSNMFAKLPEETAIGLNVQSAI